MSGPQNDHDPLGPKPKPGWRRFAIVLVLDAADADLAWESTANLLLNPYTDQQQVRHIGRPMPARNGESYEVVELHLLIDGFREVIDECE